MESPSSGASRTAKTILIGRRATNDLVLDSPNISGEHARLIFLGDRVEIEDLGSTNGTAVGDVQQKIQRARIEPSDTIYFGSSAYTAKWLIEEGRRILAGSASGSARSAPQDPADTPHPAPTPPTQLSAARLLSRIAAVGLIGLLTAGGIYRFVTSPAAKQAAASKEPLQAEAGNEPTRSASSTHSELDSPARLDPETASDLSPADRPADSRPTEAQQARAVFWVVCSDRQRQTPFRLGMAFAIGDQRFATSAAVLQALEDLRQDGFPESFLFHPEERKRLAITEVQIHPEYERAAAEAATAQREHDAYMEQVEADPPSPEKLGEVKQRLKNLRLRALRAIERKTVYDLGILAVAEKQPYRLRVAKEASLRPNLKLFLVSLPFDLEDAYFDPQMPAQPTRLDCRVQRLPRLANDSPPHLVASGADRQRELGYLGSPVLNRQGEVVAVYSRPTPAPPTSASETHAELFDGALVTHLRPLVELP